MSKVIRISDLNYQRMEKLVHKFKHTPNEIIHQLLDHYEGKGTVTSGLVKVHVEHDLTHSKIALGTFAGVHVEHWVDLLHVAHRKAFEKLGDAERVKGESTATVEMGEKYGRGFKPVSGTPFSVRSQKATDTWKTCLRLAKLLDFSISITVRWRDKAGAEKPGETHKLEWRPA